MNTETRIKPDFWIVESVHGKHQIIGAGIKHRLNGGFHLVINEVQYIARLKETTGKKERHQVQLSLPLSF